MAVRAQSEAMTTTAEAPTMADVRATAGGNGSQLRWRHVMDLMINLLGEVTAAAARDRWAACGAVTPHLQRAEALTADTTRCLSHAAGIYACHTNGAERRPPDPDRLRRLTGGLRCRR